MSTSAGRHKVGGGKKSIETLPSNPKIILIETLGSGIRKIGNGNGLDDSTVVFAEFEDPFMVWIKIEIAAPIDTVQFEGDFLV